MGFFNPTLSALVGVPPLFGVFTNNRRQSTYSNIKTRP